MMQTIFWILQLFVSTLVLDVNGEPWDPFKVNDEPQVLFFLSAECPISRFYASEIQRICREYGERRVSCGLLFEDISLEDAELRKHLEEFAYRDIRAAIDVNRRVAAETGATVTPQAVVIDKTREIRYSGRIDNFYADLGQSRRQATEHDLRDALYAIVNGRPVPRPKTDAVGCFIVPAN